MLALALAHLLHVEAAQSAGLELQWSAPTGCPDAAAVAAMVSGLVRPDATVPEPTVVRATVTRSRSGWELRLALESRRGRYERHVRSSDCRALARTTALLAAIDLDPLAVSHALGPAPPENAALPSPPERPPDGAAVVPPAPPPVPAASVTTDMSQDTSSFRGAAQAGDAALDPPVGDLSEVPASNPDREPMPADLSEGSASRAAPPHPAPLGHVRLDGGLDAGFLPGVGGHAGLFAGVSITHVRIEAGVLGAPLRIEPARADRAGGRFDRLVAALRICPGWRPRPTLALALCAGVEAGAIRGVGIEVAAPRPGWAPWLGFTLGPAARWSIAAGPLGLWFAVDGEAAVTRPIFKVGDDRVFQAGRGGARVTVGLDLQFGRRKR